MYRRWWVCEGQWCPAVAGVGKLLPPGQPSPSHCLLTCGCNRTGSCTVRPVGRCCHHEVSQGRWRGVELSPSACQTPTKAAQSRGGMCLPACRMRGAAPAGGSWTGCGSPGCTQPASYAGIVPSGSCWAAAGTWWQARQKVRWWQQPVPEKPQVRYRLKAARGSPMPASHSRHESCSAHQGQGPKSIGLSP